LVSYTRKMKRNKKLPL